MTAHANNTETFDEGLSAFREGKFSKGIRDLSKAIKLDPKKEVANLTRGVAYMQMDKVDWHIDVLSTSEGLLTI